MKTGLSMALFSVFVSMMDMLVAVARGGKHTSAAGAANVKQGRGIEHSQGSTSGTAETPRATANLAEK